MRKEICGAVFGAVAWSGAQAAESTVTLYGLVDVGVGYESVDGPNGF